MKVRIGGANVFITYELRDVASNASHQPVPAIVKAEPVGLDAETMKNAGNGSIAFSSPTRQPARATAYQKPDGKCLFLVSCSATKLQQRAKAGDLYCSAWFRKARSFVEAQGGDWMILSALYGLVHPATEIEPYNKTLKKMPVAERSAWASTVYNGLQVHLAAVDHVIILAGQGYREMVQPMLESKGISVIVPMEGLRQGEQLQWLANNTQQQRGQAKLQQSSPPPREIKSTPSSKLAMENEASETHDQCQHVEKLYAYLDTLKRQPGALRQLADASALDNLPERGVYFFMEDGEVRSTSGQGPRITRIGTHALKLGSKATLTNRLAAHRGNAGDLSGNHRGSIFRLLVGKALVRAGLAKPVITWGLGGSIGQASEKSGFPTDAIRAAERPLEERVSIHIRSMPFFVLDIDDPAGPDSLRGVVERNAIALLSNANQPIIDPASDQWLGRHCDHPRVRDSHLWNQNHVQEAYDLMLFDCLERLIGP